MNKNKKKPTSVSVKVISGIIIIAFIIFLTLPNTSQIKKDGLKQTSIRFVKNGELTFQSTDGKYISQIDIEVADTDTKREKGLMDRLIMEENQGMLFLFPYEAQQSFWMKNTVLPLDIIFVNSQNKIVTIHQNTTPFDTGTYPSTEPASQVVEVNAGYTAQHRINVGDKIVWRRN